MNIILLRLLILDFVYSFLFVFLNKGKKVSGKKFYILVFIISLLIVLTLDLATSFGIISATLNFKFPAFIIMFFNCLIITMAYKIAYNIYHYLNNR